MNFNKTITIFKPKSIKDDFGGRTVDYVEDKTIKANAAPSEEKFIAADGSIKIYSLLKVFSKEKIDLKDFRVKYEDVFYKLISKTDYSKVVMYKMEKL